VSLTKIAYVGLCALAGIGLSVSVWASTALNQVNVPLSLQPISLPANTFAHTPLQNVEQVISNLDGIGLTTPIIIQAQQNFNASSVVLGKTIQVFELGSHIQEVSKQYWRLQLNKAQIQLIPIQPLAENARYLIVLKTDIHTQQNTLPTLQTQASLGQPKFLSHSALISQQLIAYNLELSNVFAIATFKTQSITHWLSTLKAQATAQTLNIATQCQSTDDLNPSLKGLADVRVAKLALPYYLATEPNPNINANFAASSVPSTQSVPVLITLPNAKSLAGAIPPAQGWPVVIFQHSFGRNREDLLYLADQLADAGMVGVAIDLPLHGVTSPFDPFKAENNLSFADDAERTLNWDRQKNYAGVLEPDNEPDPSGANFIDYTNLLGTRDALQQAVLDLLVLRKSLVNIERNTLALDLEKVSFIGHGLGAMVGLGYLAAETKPTPSSLMNVGGGLAQLFNSSPKLSKLIQPQFAKLGIPNNGETYQQYLQQAQLVWDTVDPLVLAEQVGAQHPLQLINLANPTQADEVGDSYIKSSLSDYPLVGADVLAKRLRAQPIKASVQQLKRTVATFKEGEHFSWFNPTANPPVTAEIQQELLSFQQSQGQSITVQNSTLLQ
jgi:pimeloyl-ACP methyl ester carboxylesterase